MEKEEERLTGWKKERGPKVDIGELLVGESTDGQSTVKQMDVSEFVEKDLAFIEYIHGLNIGRSLSSLSMTSDSTASSTSASPSFVTLAPLVEYDNSMTCLQTVRNALHGTSPHKKKALAATGDAILQADAKKSPTCRRRAGQHVDNWKPQVVTNGNTDVAVDVETLQDVLCEWDGCFRTFGTGRALVDHVLTAHIRSQMPRMYRCMWQGCDREDAFKAPYLLAAHMRKHTGEKPNVCSYPGCDKSYGRRENLKVHMRMHTGERPYKCEFPSCYKAFSNRSDCAKHQNRTHSDTRPYQCVMPECTKSYTDPSSLRKHIKTMHGEEAYEVIRCKQSARGGRANGAALPAQLSSSGRQSTVSRNGEMAGESRSKLSARDLLHSQDPSISSNKVEECVKSCEQRAQSGCSVVLPKQPAITVVEDDDVQFDPAFVPPFNVTLNISQTGNGERRAKSPARIDIEHYHYNPQYSASAASRSPNERNEEFSETDLASLSTRSTSFISREISSSSVGGALHTESLAPKDLLAEHIISTISRDCLSTELFPETQHSMTSTVSEQQPIHSEEESDDVLMMASCVPLMSNETSFQSDICSFNDMDPMQTSFLSNDGLREFGANDLFKDLSSADEMDSVGVDSFARKH